MRRAFAMIDLMVSMALMFILIGLTMPQISKVREAANRSKSLNNLKQIGIAVMNYESANRRFPSLCDYGTGSPTGKGLCSLHFQILPFIEAANIHKMYDQKTPTSYYNKDTGAAKMIFKTYISPADPSAPDGVTGTSDITGVTPTFTGTYATTSYPVNGMVFQPGAGIKTMIDGTSMTIMVAERYQVCKLGKGDSAPTATSPDVYTMWGLGAYSNATAAFALATPEGKDVPVATPANKMFVPKSTQHNLALAEGYWASDPKTQVKYASTLISGAPGGFQVAPKGTVICDARVPQTPHTGGILVCMGDVSTRTVAGNINPLTFWSAVTPQGNEVLGSDW